MTDSRPLIFGEVLFDRFPDGIEVLGGAPFNVAWHLQAFGLNSLFISRVGDDTLGGDIRSAMAEWGMDTSGLQRDATHPSGTVQVSLDAGEPRFEILPKQAYDFIDPSELPAAATGAALYHGSLALRHGVSRAALEKLGQGCRGPRFVDVNLRAPWWEKEHVLSLIKEARWVKLNEDELNVLVADEPDFGSRVNALQTSYKLDLLCVTRGEAGAMVCTLDGECLEVRPEPSLQVVDTVGAGDAFAAVLLLGLTRQWPLSRILDRAQAFASAIVTVHGATVRDKGFYQSFIRAWGLS